MNLVGAASAAGKRGWQRRRLKPPLQVGGLMQRLISFFREENRELSLSAPQAWRDMDVGEPAPTVEAEPAYFVNLLEYLRRRNRDAEIGRRNQEVMLGELKN